MKITKRICPCGSGKGYDHCCEPIIAGETSADSAVALMRSRFTAYSIGDSDYIMNSWHSSTRPQHISLEPEQQWTRLKIIASGEDFVEFVATFKIGGKAARLHEHSRFVCQQGQWYYLDGEIRDA